MIDLLYLSRCGVPFHSTILLDLKGGKSFQVVLQKLGVLSEDDMLICLIKVA